jgi:sulfate permease, SulP family
VPAPATPGSQTEAGLIVYRFGADLFYANADRFANEVCALVDKAPAPVRWFVVDASAVTDLDYSAARTVRDLLGELTAKNACVVFGRVNAYLRADLDTE